MSAPVVTFFMSALAAKSAIDGLREGNILKAVVGAVGAYAGFSGLASLGTTASTGAVAGSATNAVAGEMGTEVAEQVVAGGVTEGAGVVAGETTIASQPVVPPVAQGSPGLLETVGTWAEKNPKLATGLLQLGGNALQGSAQEDMATEAWKRENKLKAEERKRRGYSAPSGLLGKQRFNPATGQWEVM